jgi:D-amino-acid dehydrogenase
MHICVIGAGAVGLTTAYFLQSEGHTVSIVERESTAGFGASGGNGAQLSYAFVAPLADATIPYKLPGLVLSRHAPLKLHPRADLAQLRWALQFLRHANQRAARKTTEALLKLAELSREFIEPLIEGERIECDFTRGGKLVVYPDMATLDAARSQLTYQAALGTRGQVVLSAAECAEREPAIAGYVEQIVGGVWTPTEAAADCDAFCTQVAALLMRRGAEIHYDRAVRRIDCHDGRVRALITDAGSLRADAFVLAAGDAAAALGRSAGLDLPVLPLKGYSITVRPDKGATLPRASITDVRRKIVFAPLGDFGREETGVGISDAVDLRVHRGEHVRVRVPKARHGRAARGVEVCLPGRIGDPAAAGAGGDRVVTSQLAVQQVGVVVHGGLPARCTGRAPSRL